MPFIKMPQKIRVKEIPVAEKTWEDYAALAVNDMFIIAASIERAGARATMNAFLSINTNNLYFDSIDFQDDDMDNITYIKTIIDHYISTKSWNYEPGVMKENQPGSVIKDCKRYHSCLIGFMGALAIHYCLVNDIDLTRESLTSTLIKKQKDYGPNNIARFGLNGLIIRTHDKIARLENLMGKKNGVKNAVENESFYDTLLDIGGYAAIGLMWTEGTFFTPLREE